VNARERFHDEEEIFRNALQAFVAGVWTALPGIIQSYDAAKVTVVVQPATRGVVQTKSGALNQVDLPLLVDVPVVFPHGGNCTLTFPLEKGDECLVVFSSRCMDEWWQSGNVQLPQDPRMHDLSDGFAIPGPFSQAALTAIAARSTTTVQLRSDDGSTYVELDPAGQVVNVVAPGGMSITSPMITITGDVALNGGLVATGDVKASAISLETHKHLGVTTGGGTSGLPTP